MPQNMSVSRARSFRKCPRHHYYSNELRLVPRKSEALHFGTLFHAALASWWIGASIDECLVHFEEAEPYTRAQLRALMRGYDARWKAERIECHGVETKYHLPLVNPATGKPSKVWQLKIILDAEATQGGQRWVVEHKTTSEDIGPGADYWDRLRLDAQCSAYLQGTGATGVIYDVIRKPTIKPAKESNPETRYKKDGGLKANCRDRDEDPDEYEARIIEDIASDPDRYFARCQVVRLEHEQAEAATDLWQTAQAIRESQRSGSWPRNPDACIRFNSKCEFWGLCTHRERVDDYERSKPSS